MKLTMLIVVSWSSSGGLGVAEGKSGSKWAPTGVEAAEREAVGGEAEGGVAEGCLMGRWSCSQREVWNQEPVW